MLFSAILAVDTANNIFYTANWHDRRRRPTRQHSHQRLLFCGTVMVSLRTHDWYHFDSPCRSSLVRCFSCGKVIGDKWNAYLELLANDTSEGSVPFSTCHTTIAHLLFCPVIGTDALELKRYCCRMRWYSHTLTWLRSCCIIIVRRFDPSQMFRCSWQWLYSTRFLSLLCHSPAAMERTKDKQGFS